MLLHSSVLSASAPARARPGRRRPSVQVAAASGPRVASQGAAERLTQEERSSFTRRALVASLGLLSFGASNRAAIAAPDSGDWTSPGLAKGGPTPTYKKLPSGVIYEEIYEGSGEPAAPGDVAQFDYVLRRSNGYFIYGTPDCGIGCGNGEPVSFTLGSGALIPGLDELLTGMRPGESRRALIPPSVGYGSDPTKLEPQPPEFGQKRQLAVHARENLIFEVRMRRVKKRGG